MKTAGIICEFNPFHNGHKHIICEAKKEHDAVVCIMSGSFVQRGEVAIYDKWTRTKAALLNGADLVLELPVRYSLSSAQGFSSGAVKILECTNVIDSLIFGSECADIEKLTSSARILSNEPPQVSAKIKELLLSGVSFPRARAEAFDGLIEREILDNPNNILGLEYIMTLKKTGSRITPVTIPRKSVEHKSLTPNGEFASASALREMIKKGEDISAYTPFDFSSFVKYDTDKLSDIFRYKLITEGAAAFSGIIDMEPGLENRFIQAASIGCISKIIDEVKTKRYTHARLKRIAMSVILGLGGEYKDPQYIRILGMNDMGKQLLSQMRKKSELPIINKVSDYKGEGLSEEIKATNIAALSAFEKVPQNRDFTTSPVIL